MQTFIRRSSLFASVQMTSRLCELCKLSYLCPFRSCIIPFERLLETDVHIIALSLWTRFNVTFSTHINRIQIVHSNGVFLVQSITLAEDGFTHELACPFWETHVRCRAFECAVSTHYMSPGITRNYFKTWSIVIKFLFCSIKEFGNIHSSTMANKHIKSK